MLLQERKLWVLVAMGLLSLPLGGLLLTQQVQLQALIDLVHQAGAWGRLVFLVGYVTATLLILPSTAFNLAGGAIYGVWEGLLLTSLGGLISAVIAFGLARWLGQEALDRHLSGTGRTLSDRLQQGGLPYTFAARLFPIIPYGVVSFVGGLSQIRLPDYVLGTLLGTPFGNIPFVWLGSSGMQALNTHNLWPVTLATAVLALLIGLGTWYQQQQGSSP